MCTLLANRTHAIFTEMKHNTHIVTLLIHDIIVFSIIRVFCFQQKKTCFFS